MNLWMLSSNNVFSDISLYKLFLLTQSILLTHCMNLILIFTDTLYNAFLVINRYWRFIRIYLFNKWIILSMSEELIW